MMGAVTATQESFEILLVEDDPSDVELTVRALRKHQVAGRVRHARDGAQALELLFACRDLPRIVILDLKLPKVSGLEVLRRIRADERLRTLPVIVVSSSQEDPDINAAYGAGANSYVVKPIESGAFVDALGRLGAYWLQINRQPLRGPTDQ